MLLAYALAVHVVGRIPVSNGAGWDGSLYLRQAQEIASGLIPTGAPYHLSRMPGFAPLILAAYAGLSEQQLLSFQTFFNAGQLAIAASLFIRLMLDWGLSRKLAWLSVLYLCMSWPWLVMPVYYPILSDHSALFVSVLSMWCWSKNMHRTLACLTFASVWIMPGLFVVPLILSCFPHRAHSSSGVASGTPAKWFNGVQAIAVVFALPLFFFFLVSPIKDTDISQHPGGVDVAWISLKWLSAVGILLSITVICLAWTKLFLSKSFWQALSLQSMFWSLLGATISLLLLLAVPNWKEGYSGPPLLDYMLLQSLAAPLKPAVAHFLYFGPIISITIITIFRWSLSESTSLSAEPRFGLKVTILAFLPFLLLGSESRQWIAVFPIVVAWFCTTYGSNRRLTFITIICFSMLATSPYLGIASQQSNIMQLPLTHPDWQLYFGRQGPWMSREYYLIGAVLLALILLAYHLIGRPSPYSPPP
jgi:hypothetical protein